MDAYQCPGGSLSTGVHVSRISLHYKVKKNQMDNKQEDQKQIPGNGSPPSSPVQPRSGGGAGGYGIGEGAAGAGP